MAFGNASIHVKVSLIALCVGILVFIIGFATSYWFDFGGYHYGLFFAGISRLLPDFIKACQALGFIGLFAAAGSLVLLILYTFVSQFNGKKLFALLAWILAGGGGISVIIAVIIFGAKQNYAEVLGWSFGLACAGGIIFLICAVLLFCEWK